MFNGVTLEPWSGSKHMKTMREMPVNLTNQAQAVEQPTSSSGTGVPGARRKCGFRHVLLACTAFAIAGCGSGSPTTGTYSAECKPIQLIPGQQQKIEVTVHYALPSNPKEPTPVSYQARMTAPSGWSLAENNWEFSHTMKTTDIGFRETRNLLVSVPADAAQGQHVLKLLISPASEPAQSVNLQLQVVNPGK
jgi:hypothetical protein